jgi:hypothetical protein
VARLAAIPQPVEQINGLLVARTGDGSHDKAKFLAVRLEECLWAGFKSLIVN